MVFSFDSTHWYIVPLVNPSLKPSGKIKVKEFDRDRNIQNARRSDKYEKVLQKSELE